MARDVNATPPSSTHEQIRARYAQSALENEGLLKRLQSRWRNLGFVRGGSFLLSLVPLLAAVTNAASMAYSWWWVFGATFLGFVLIAGYHETIASQIRTYRLRLKMDRASLARLDRRLKDIFEATVEAPQDNQATCRDLDLFGEHSLYRLTGTVRTPVGIELMKSWMSDGASSDVIVDRQKAVAALKSQDEWRGTFALRCEKLSASQSGPSDFVRWCQDPTWFDRFAWVLWLSRICSVIVVVVLVLMIAGMVSLPIGAPIVIAAMLVNFFLSVIFAGSVHDIFNQISSRHDEMVNYQSLFQSVQECPSKSSLLDRLRQEMFESGDILKGLPRLGMLVWLANLRRNALLFLFYIFLQLVFFWDVHLLDRLEVWKRTYGSHARNWFNGLGEWEALTALAKLASDHPDWVFPTILPKSGDSKLDAKKMGHPLLPVDSRVDNDLQMGPPGTFLLVTGSNMSGKSTLLRSIGLNVTLAQMGSVVCARSFSLPTVVVDTSMRISDSLSDGVSFFMAELKRLKAVVDRSAEQSKHPNRGHLFLLDEILQGTNSRERQIAVARVIKQLVQQKSIGAISTHDLELAGVDSLKCICQVVHFTESFETRDGQEVMTFDYRMRSGVAPTTNALKLLEIVGLAARDRE